MGLFSKNPNEAAYTGGKKHWGDIIKNSDHSGESLISRAPEEDFNTNSTLIVELGEEAIFVKDGKIEEIFENGRYQLSTENYPVISRLRNAFTGGISTFNCVIYFVKKADSKEIGWGWGESSPLRIEDPKFEIDINIISTGAFKIAIEKPALLLERLAGNVDGIVKNEFYSEYIRGIVIQTVKSTIKQIIENDKTDRDIIAITGNLEEFQKQIEGVIEEKILTEYGIKLRYFIFEKITPAENDPGYLEIQQQKRQYSRMRKFNVDYRTQQALDMMNNISQNEGSGGIAAAGAGLGMGVAAGGMFGSMAQQVFSPAQQPAQPLQQQPSGRFSQKSAAEAGEVKENPVEKIKLLKEMFDIGAISQEEFDAKKQEILSRI